MRRLSIALVSSILCLGAAQAQTMAPTDVAATLAKSHALDLRCNILAEKDRDELMDFLARAEILVAERESVGVARKALARGKAQGGEGPCGPEQAKFVTDILATARSSVGDSAPVQEAVEPQAVEPQPMPPKQIEASAAPVPEPTIVASQPKAEKPPTKKIVAAQKPVKQKPDSVKMADADKKPKAKALAAAVPAIKKKPGNSLSKYAGVAERYYVELKCRNMSGAAMQRLYANVLANHKQAVAENGPGAVRSVLRTAESRAGASRCS